MHSQCLELASKQVMVFSCFAAGLTLPYCPLALSHFQTPRLSEAPSIGQVTNRLITPPGGGCGGQATGPLLVGGEEGTWQMVLPSSSQGSAHSSCPWQRVLMGEDS